MNKPNPADAQQVKAGDKIVLLVGPYDPAHMDYFRAIEALVSYRGVSQVWVAPFANDQRPEHVMNMCNMLALDATRATGKQVGCCTVPITKRFYSPDELRGWCQRVYPNVVFQTARMDGQHSTEDIAVSFAGRPLTGQEPAEHIDLREHLSQPEDLVERIQRGQDMVRSFPEPVWEYIQQYRLYRSGN